MTADKRIHCIYLRAIESMVLGQWPVLIQSFPSHFLQQCIKTKIFDTFIGKWKNRRFNFTYGRISHYLKKLLYACNNKLTQLTLTITFCSMHNEIVRTCTSPNTIVNWYGAYKNDVDMRHPQMTTMSLFII